MNLTRAQWALVLTSGCFVVAPHPLLLALVGCTVYASINDWRLEFRGGKLGPWVPWLPAIAVGTVLLATSPMPRDDLLAIVAIATGDFDHHSFVGSDWGGFGSPWVGLEWVVRQLAEYIGKEAAIRVLQIVAVGGSLAVVTIAVTRETERGAARGVRDWLIAAAVLVLVFRAGLPMRAVGARAESFFAVLVLAAFVLRPAAWFVVAVALSPLYWLSPIYAPAALLLRAPVRTRLLVGGGVFFVASGVWWGLTDGHWLEWIIRTGDWVGLRMGGAASVTENASLLQSLGSPAIVTLIVVFVLLARQGAIKTVDWPIAAVIAWFALPDMIRYAPLVAALAGVWIARALARPEGCVRGAEGGLWLSAPLLIWYLVNGSSMGEEVAPHFSLPDGAAVLSEPAPSYLNLAYESRKIRLAPSFEPGADDPRIQAAALGLAAKGSLDCAVAEAFRFEYVAEKSLRKIPDCLVLRQVSGPWRLWQVIARPVS